MGFISSILCCSTDTNNLDSNTSNQSKKYSNTRNNTQSKKTNYNNKVTATDISRNTDKSKTNTNKSSNTQKDKNRKSETNQGKDIKDSNNRNIKDSNMTAHYKSNDHHSSTSDHYQDASSTGSPKIEKKIDGGNVTSGSNENNTISSNRNSEPHKEDEKGSVEGFQDEEEDYDMSGDKDDNDKLNEKINEKQTINVYNNETDRSTGTSSSDNVYSQQQAQAQEQQTQHDIPQDPQQYIASVDPNNTSNNIQTEQQIYQDVNDVANDADYNMVPTYEDSEEYVDLTELQPDQYHAPGYTTLLSPITKQFKDKKCLVLDLDETLVHSSFKYLRSADFVLPVDIDDQIHNVYVIKRPGVDEFLKRVGELYEVVVFTASVSRYGDPLLDRLDINKAIHHRLFRDACYNYDGNYIKNLSQIGRPLSEIIILDNSPASYIFHPQHAIPISSWFSDTHDNELLDIIPLLEDLSKNNVLDVGKVLDVSI